MEGKHRIRNLFVRMLFLALLGWAVALVRAVRRRQGWDEWSDGEEEWATPRAASVDEQSIEPQATNRPFTSHKLATSLAFVTVFFAAASFTAVGGDLAAKALDPARCAALMQATGEGEDVCAELLRNEEPAAAEPPLEAVPAEEAAPEVAAAPDATPAAEADASTPSEAPAAESESVQAEADAAAAAPQTEPSAASPSASPAGESSQGELTSASAEPLVLTPARPARSAPRSVVERAVGPKAKPLPLETEGGDATVWLNRALADPTPPAKRLSPAFAKKLQRISAVNGVSWALVLGVLRAEGHRGRTPATVRELNALARGLRERGAIDSEWNAVLALAGRTSFADRAVALARYNRAVGLRALVEGLEAAKQRLIDGLLADQRVSVYGGGRDDLQAGRIDVRVVVLIQYLAETFDQVTVTSLFSGHRKYARPGVVSAHIYGQAVDIAAVAGKPIYGNSAPGGLTEKAVRSILWLPVEVQPRQLISLLGLGGPSFPLADHADHIHVGY
jgi:hypothetical protein